MAIDIPPISGFFAKIIKDSLEATNSLRFVDENGNGLIDKGELLGKRGVPVRGDLREYYIALNRMSEQKPTRILTFGKFGDKLYEGAERLLELTHDSNLMENDKLAVVIDQIGNTNPMSHLPGYHVIMVALRHGGIRISQEKAATTEEAISLAMKNLKKKAVLVKAKLTFFGDDSNFITSDKVAMHRILKSPAVNAYDNISVFANYAHSPIAEHIVTVVAVKGMDIKVYTSVNADLRYAVNNAMEDVEKRAYDIFKAEGAQKREAEVDQIIEQEEGIQKASSRTQE